MVVGLGANATLRFNGIVLQPNTVWSTRFYGMNDGTGDGEGTTGQSSFKHHTWRLAWRRWCYFQRLVLVIINVMAVLVVFPTLSRTSKTDGRLNAFKHSVVI